MVELHEALQVKSRELARREEVLDRREQALDRKEQQRSRDAVLLQARLSKEAGRLLDEREAELEQMASAHLRRLEHATNKLREQCAQLRAAKSARRLLAIDDAAAVENFWPQQLPSPAPRQEPRDGSAATRCSADAVTPLSARKLTSAAWLWPAARRSP